MGAHVLADIADMWSTCNAFIFMSIMSVVLSMLFYVNPEASFACGVKLQAGTGSTFRIELMNRLVRGNELK